MKIEYKKLEEIKPYKNNPRINRKTIEKLKELIKLKEVEFNVPIVIDKDGVIIKGHSRYFAFKELGEKKIPTIVSNNSTEINNEDRLQDNIIQELSTWKTEDLTIELRENKINAREYELKLPKIGYGDIVTKDVTAVDIIKSSEVFLGVKQPKKEFIELICPYCGEEFMLSKEEVKKYV